MKRYIVRDSIGGQIKTTVDTLDEYYKIAIKAAPTHNKRYGVNYEAFDTVTKTTTNLANIGK